MPQSISATWRAPPLQWDMHDVVAVITDLFFQARISSSARRMNRTVFYVPSDATLDDVRGYSLALVDLDAGLDVARAIGRLRSLDNGLIVAFGPHVDTERRRAAKRAGADRVLAKSKFVSELPALLGASAELLDRVLPPHSPRK